MQMDGIWDPYRESKENSWSGMMAPILKQQLQRLGHHCCAAGLQTAFSSRSWTEDKGKEKCKSKSKRKRQEEKDAEKKEDREEEHTPHSKGEKDQPANVSGRARRFPTMMEAAWGLRAGGTMNAGEV